MSSSNSIGDFDLNVVKIRKPLEFPDGTIQSTAGGGGGNQNLQQVLTTGNNAGGLSMTNIATINGSAYPPATSNIQQVLTAGNDAGALSILNLNDVDCNSVQGKPYPPTLGFVMGSGAIASANLDMDNFAIIDVATINGSAYPPSTPNLSAVMTAGNTASTSLNMSNNDITNVNNMVLNTLQTGQFGLTGTMASNINMNNNNITNVALINGSAYPPSTPTLSAVMTAGATASVDLNMNNNDITNVATINGVAYPPPSVITLYTPALLSADTASGSEFILTTQVVPAGTYTISASVMINVNSSQYLLGQLIEMGTESGGAYTSLAGISGGNGTSTTPQYSQSGIILTQTFSFPVQSNVFVSTTCVCNASATWRTITAGNPAGSAPKSYVSILRVA